MTVQALAFRMRCDLAKLASKFATVPMAPLSLSLDTPVDRDVIISGLAVSTQTDNERMRFAPWCFSNPCLLIEHEKPRLMYGILSPPGR
jgi:hypothetical protein